MSDDPKKKKKKTKKSKSPQKVIKDALKGADLATKAEDPPSDSPAPHEDSEKTIASATNHKYDDMEFVGKVKKGETEAAADVGPTYNEITFHEAGVGGTAEGAAGTDAYNEVTFHQPGDGPNVQPGANRGVQRFSASYEVPSPTATSVQPPSTVGYMALNVRPEAASEYDTAGVGNRRAKKVLGNVLTSLGVTEEERDTLDSREPSKFHSTKWSLVMVIVSLIVSLIAILLSIVALGLNGKCNSCNSPLVGDVNCSFNLISHCNFTTGLDESCVTSPHSVRDGISCVVTLPAQTTENLFVTTILNHNGMFSCQCYQTNGTFGEMAEIARCSMMLRECMLT
jgi:hypothetical protein